MDHIYTPPGYATSYPRLLRALYDINGLLKRDGIMAPSDSSLHNTRRLYDLLGRPLDKKKTIHVGGTNGKGTTSFKISECLRRSGIRTGLFVSPHLSSFRERVQVDGQLASEEDLLRHMPVVLQLCAAHSVPLTLFEITFLYACVQFEASGCQAVVLEVGLGGELDATNVVSTALSIICSVSLDHMRVLGSTVVEIAAKKGGIFKHGVDALIGPDCPYSVLRAIADERGALLHTLAEAQVKFSIPAAASDPGTEAGGADLIDTDALNADLSLAALYLLRAQGSVFADLNLEDGVVAKTLQTARPPCRWERHSVAVQRTGPGSEANVEVVLDVGHNQAAVTALMRRIKRDFADRNVRLLYAMSRDKDVATCLRAVIATIPSDRIHFAQSDNFRAISQQELSAIFRQETGADVTDLDAATAGLPLSETFMGRGKMNETLARVLALAAHESDDGTGVVVICGTGYIMPDARAQIGIVEPRCVFLNLGCMRCLPPRPLFLA